MPRHIISSLKHRITLLEGKNIPRVSNPTGPPHRPGHVIRGGDFNSYPWQWRSAARKWYGPQYRNLHVGFRVVLESDQDKLAKPTEK